MKTIRKRNVIHFILGMLLGVACSGQIPLASQRFAVTAEDGQVCLFPYEASGDLNAANAAIERAVISVHSLGQDALSYYRNALMAMEQAKADPDTTLIIAPHFLHTKTLAKLTDAAQRQSGYLVWQENPFWGISKGQVNGKGVTISPFDVLDQMVLHLADSGRFPNLKTIAILGHSAGGQLVGRYAASNRVEHDVLREREVGIKYLVMAPSSYVYLTPERLTRNPRLAFEVPDEPPRGYHDWGYGTDNLFVYHKTNNITAALMRQRYADRTVLYLVGSRDNDNDGQALDKKAGALLQGRNRLERCRVYYDYLKHLYGPQITQHQRYWIVPDAGHSGRRLMTSPPALKFLFEEP